jgi:hypothetical protein
LGARTPWHPGCTLDVRQRPPEIRLIIKRGEEAGVRRLDHPRLRIERSPT